MSNDTMKTCTKCGNTYPATNEYFNQGKKYKNGLNSWCKACYREYNRANKNRIAEIKRIWHQENKNTVDEYQRQYREENKVKLAKQAHDRYEANKDIRAKKAYEYRQVNKDKIREINRIYKQENPHKMRVNYHRREARKRSLPDTFTSDQWQICLEYFNYSCAICGISFENIESHVDHLIPLASDECLGTVATNMVCLCEVCNLSKNATMPDIWLAKRYSASQADEILARIEAYFQSLNP